ncbi:MAG: hypothetical protein WCO59_06685, partial [Actinomycetes bacterium]
MSAKGLKITRCLFSVFLLIATSRATAATWEGSDNFTSGVSGANWTQVQQIHGTAVSAGANGHASFLVSGPSSAEQEAWLLWNGHPTANTDWTLEFKGHNAANFSSAGASQFQLIVGDPRALTGGTPYSFTCEFSRGNSAGGTQASFQSGNFANGGASGAGGVINPSTLAVTDFLLRVIYRSISQRFEAWYDDTGVGLNWKFLRAATLSTMQPDATGSSQFVVGVIANCYIGPIVEGQLWADDFRLVNALLDVPTITTHPTNQTVAVGGNVSFTVQSIGGTGYQWRLNGTNIGGATAATYTILGAQTGNVGNYSVIVSNANGGVVSGIASLSVTNQPPALWLPKDSNRHWLDIAMSANGRNCVAVDYNHGRGGYVYTSSDGGATWTPRMTDALRAWTCVASSGNGQRLVAGVGGGSGERYLYTSTDAGITWSQRENSRWWASVASSTNGIKLVAAASGGQIYTSSDAGETWIARESVHSWQSVASSADGTHLAAVFSVAAPDLQKGSILTSADSGVTWHAATPLGYWSGIACSADGSKLVASDGNFQASGYIYTSADFGATWTQRADFRQWYSVASSADGNRLVACVF